MVRRTEFWVVSLGMLVAGIVVAGWLATGPVDPSHAELSVLVAMVTMFGWAAALIGRTPIAPDDAPRVQGLLGHRAYVDNQS